MRGSVDESTPVRRRSGLRGETINGTPGPGQVTDAHHLRQRHGTVARRMVTLVAVLAIAFGTVGCLPTRGANTSDPYQLLMVSASNADRAASGLPPLVWSPKLGGLAQGWVLIMADSGVLHHRDLGAVISDPEYRDFSTLGENIIVGPPNMTIAHMETAYMNSPGHRANILNPAFNLIGVAFVEHGGLLWGVVNFGGAP